MRLFDSNVVIELVRRADAALQRRVLTGGFAVSVVTRIEALGFHRLREEEERELDVIGLGLGAQEALVGLAVGSDD